MSTEKVLRGGRSLVTLPAMNLKARAIEVGLTQTKIGAELGVSDATVSAWLNRDRPIPTVYLRPLATLLKAPVDDLLPPDEPRQSGESAPHGKATHIGRSV